MGRERLVSHGEDRPEREKKGNKSRCFGRVGGRKRRSVWIGCCSLGGAGGRERTWRPGDGAGGSDVGVDVGASRVVVLGGGRRKPIPGKNSGGGMKMSGAGLEIDTPNLGVRCRGQRENWGPNSTFDRLDRYRGSRGGQRRSPLC